MSPREQCHDLASAACEGSKRAYLQKINYLNRELSVNQTPVAKLEALIVMQGAKGIDVVSRSGFFVPYLPTTPKCHQVSGHFVNYVHSCFE